MIDFLDWLANETPKIHPLLDEVVFLTLWFISMMLIGTVLYYIHKLWHKFQMELHEYREFKKSK